MIKINLVIDRDSKCGEGAQHLRRRSLSSVGEIEASSPVDRSAGRCDPIATCRPSPRFAGEIYQKGTGEVQS